MPVPAHPKDPAPKEMPFDYLDALDDAMTREVWRKVCAYTSVRVRILAQAGYPVDPDLVERLVSDAVADTALGECRWDPASCALTTHLCGVIRGRTHKRILRNRKIRYLSVDAHAEGERGLDETMMLGEQESAEDEAARVQATARFVGALCAAAEAKGDRDVIAILDAFRDGLAARAEVVEHLGMKRKQYDRARERMMRMISRLPADVREEAVEVMRSRS